MTDTKKVRPFLKWAGGKYELFETIDNELPEGDLLIEPFVGAGAIFLNSNYKKYILNDINSDLINLYKTIQTDSESFILDARKFFKIKFNSEESFYRLRTKFNKSKDIYERSLIFLYLNRHCYNGLCRYNKSGLFNVPFGRYKKPMFPEASIEIFSEKAKKATFTCESFTKTFSRTRSGHVVYCDPPYAPLSKTASFSDYTAKGFSVEDQILLADKAKSAAKRGVAVIISNHNTLFTQKIYKGAEIKKFKARRSISCVSGERNKASELLAIYKGKLKRT